MTDAAGEPGIRRSHPALLERDLPLVGSEPVVVVKLLSRSRAGSLGNLFPHLRWVVVWDRTLYLRPTRRQGSGGGLLALLAYAGLRPIEDRGCTWGDLRDRTLHVFATKTSRPRDVDLIAPRAQDLAEWRMACGRPQDDELVIPRPSRGQWTREDLANWRRRVRRPAAIEAGVTGDLRPYRLRGSFVSLLLWEGHSLTYVAEQAGHSIATLARHYAGAGNQAPRPGG
jgi:Phage integrase family